VVRPESSFMSGPDVVIIAGFVSLLGAIRRWAVRRGTIIIVDGSRWIHPVCTFTERLIVL
jgi:hypothetical protein